MKFIYKLLSLSLAIACLSGCSAANTEIASSSAATATVTPTTDSTEVSAYNNVFTSAGDGLYVTTDSGIYELQTVFPDSANIFYTDANTKERIFLCANPNCTHADESCPSYIATPSAMFPPMLLRVGDQLLVVFTEATDSSNPHGMLMNMDGSNRRTVFELASNQYMQGGFCTSGNDLYFDLYEINDSGNVTYQLWYVSFENGTSEKLMDLGSDSDHYSLCDGANNELCFNHVSSDGISYCMYNPQSKTISDPFFVDSNITYEVFNQYGSPASGGERSEYNLLQELSDGVKNSILILDEPESSFDNIFLRDGVDSLLKDISKTIPVIIATHNNTIGVSVHPDYIVYACKEVLSDGKLEYHLYSGYPSSEDLVDLKGNHISRKSVLLDCLEAGEAAYMDRRNSYEILNG